MFPEQDSQMSNHISFIADSRLHQVQAKFSSMGQTAAVYSGWESPHHDSSHDSI